MKKLERLVIGLVFVVLWLPLSLQVSKVTSHKVRIWVESLEGAPLEGMQNAVVTPKFTWSNLMSGAFQKQVEAWQNEQIPLRRHVIRATNQLYYSVFAKSYMQEGSITIGRGKQLYEKTYLMKYCNTAGMKIVPNQEKKLVKVFEQPATSDDFEKWIGELKEVADFFHQRGQTFIYLITPSKAAYYPEDIPAGFYCSPVTPRIEYQMAISVLGNSGLNYIDGSKVVLDAKGKYPVELFPHTGIHWTSLAATLTTRELLAKISQITRRDLPGIEFSQTIDRNPIGSDVDLLQLLNLWQPNRDFSSSKLSFKKLDRQPIRLAVVGGSFVHQLMHVLDSSEMFCQMDHYYYLEIEHIRYPSKGGCGVKQEDPGSYQALLSAQVIVFEENEANLRSPHFQLLRAVLKQGKLK